MGFEAAEELAQEQKNKQQEQGLALRFWCPQRGGDPREGQDLCWQESVPSHVSRQDRAAVAWQPPLCVCDSDTTASPSPSPLVPDNHRNTEAMEGFCFLFQRGKGRNFEWGSGQPEVPVHCRVWDEMAFKASFQPKYSVIP